MDKALIACIALCLAALLSLTVFWASELYREPVSFSEPDCLNLEVRDKPLLDDAAKKEALSTGRAWFYRNGELVIMENVPEQYLED